METSLMPADDPTAPGLVRVPGWEQYPWLRAGFSTRFGGGTSVYGWPGEQNLGWTAEDDPGIVAQNRRRFLAATAETALPGLVTVRQIHGAIIHTVPTTPATALSTPDGRAVLEGDGLMTQASGVFLGVQTADCVPVLLADTHPGSCRLPRRLAGYAGADRRARRGTDAAGFWLAPGGAHRRYRAGHPAVLLCDRRGGPFVLYGRVPLRARALLRRAAAPHGPE
jgi:hypothetical protein